MREQLHHFIARRRRQLRLSRPQLAAAIQITVPALAMLEAGNRRLDLHRLSMLARALKADLRQVRELAQQDLAPGTTLNLFEDMIEEPP
jgi:transcriptional regulator with XRE-family HTH domain